MNKLKMLMKESGYTFPMLSNILRQRFRCYKYPQQISQWFNGVRLPDIESVYYLSLILSISCDNLIPMFMEIRNEK